MTSFGAKLAEMLRNLRSDAVPRAPRRTSETNDVTLETGENQNNEPEGIFEEKSQDKNTNSNYHYKKNRTKKSKEKSEPKYYENGASKINNLNTQAGGPVFNIIDSPDFHFGHEFVYNLGSTTQCNHSKTSETYESDEYIEKTNEITLLMEANISPEHEYIDYVSKNLGKNWHHFFRKLGYTKGRIETFEIDESRNGVSEARYKLLLDWIRNDDDGTLGRLVNVLWAEGERRIVKELSIIYTAKNYL